MLTVREIDRELDGIYRRMKKLEKIEPYSAASWQDAWDKHPDIRAEEQALYRQRWQAHDLESAAKFKAMKVPRIKRPKKCPTCGCKTLYT